MAALASTGCHLVFGADPGSPGGEDAATDAATMVPRCTTDGERVELPVVADTVLDGTMEQTSHGREPVLRLDPQRTVLLRVEKGGTTLRAIEILLPVPETAPGCSTGGASCEACVPLTFSGASITFIPSDWSEADATYLLRAEGQPWSSPGARGEDVAHACDATADGPARMACAGQMVRSLSLPDHLTLAIRAGSGTYATLPSREGVAECDVERVQVTGICRIGADACGNRAIDLNEECDDGNPIEGDGCDSNCTVTACGNGIRTSGEQCDDGNSENDDGCSTSCRILIIP